MNLYKRCILLTAVFGIMAFGCSDDVDSNEEAQSSDDIAVSGSDSATSLDTDSGQVADTTPYGDTASSLPVDTGTTGDTAVVTDTATDSNSLIDTNDSAGTDTDTGSIDTGTAIDSATDSESSSDDTDTLTCPYACRTQNGCLNSGGTVLETLACSEPTQVCCQPDNDSDSSGEDTDTDTDDTETPDDTDSTTDAICDVGCHSASWCHTNSATIYEDLTCTGNQICCEIMP